MSPYLDVDHEEVENYRGFAIGSRVTVIFLTLLARRMCMFAEDKILTEAKTEGVSGLKYFETT